MNYAFHIDLGDMPYDKWQAMYSAPENKAKRAEWWGPEHVGKSGENSAVILAQINDEEKLTEHMKFVRDMASKMGMKHQIFKLSPDDR